VRPPTFRKRSKFRSFAFKQTGCKLGEGDRLAIQGQKYRFHQSRPTQDDIKTVTVKRDALGDFWITFSCDNVPVPEPKAATGQSAGLDFELTCDAGTRLGNNGGRLVAPRGLEPRTY
jgi:putative transposase